MTDFVQILLGGLSAMWTYESFISTDRHPLNYLAVACTGEAWLIRDATIRGVLLKASMMPPKWTMDRMRGKQHLHIGNRPVIHALLREPGSWSKVESARQLLASGVAPGEVARNPGVSVPPLYHWLPASTR